MGLFSKIFGSKQTKNSRQIAHDRLKLVLIHDRINISPEVMDAIKKDIIQVIARHLKIDQNTMDIFFEKDVEAMALIANIPLKNVKRTTSPEQKPRRF